MTTMEEIEQYSQAHAKARTNLISLVTLLQAEIEAAKKKRMARIKEAVIKATETGDALLALVQASPTLFRKPKSVTLYGIKAGWKKQKGKIEIADEAQTIKLIRKHLPELEDVLIVSTEKPSKEAMNTLEAGQLKKIGVTITSDTDVAFIAAADTDVDKIVNALLKGAEEAA